MTELIITQASSLLAKWGVTSVDPLLEQVKTAILCETTEDVAEEAVEIMKDAFALLDHRRSPILLDTGETTCSIGAADAGEPYSDATANKVATSREIMIAGGVDPDAPFEVGPFPSDMRQADTRGQRMEEVGEGMQIGTRCSRCGTSVPEAFANQCNRPECEYRQSITPPEGGELVEALKPFLKAADLAHNNHITAFVYVSDLLRLRDADAAALSTPELSAKMVDRQNGDQGKAEASDERFRAILEEQRAKWIAAIQPIIDAKDARIAALSDTKGLVDALEWIRNYAIKLRRGIDDWFDLVEIELFATNALAQHRGSTL